MNKKIGKGFSDFHPIHLIILRRGNRDVAPSECSNTIRFDSVFVEIEKIIEKGYAKLRPGEVPLILFNIISYKIFKL